MEKDFFIPFEILLQPFCLHNNVSVVRNALIMTPFPNAHLLKYHGSKNPKGQLGDI